MTDEIRKYIARSVAHIARMCHCKDNEVISEMGGFVADWTYKHFDEIKKTQYHN